MNRNKYLPYMYIGHMANFYEIQVLVTYIYAKLKSRS